MSIEGGTNLDPALSSLRQEQELDFVEKRGFLKLKPPASGTQ